MSGKIFYSILLAAVIGVGMLAAVPEAKASGPSHATTQLLQFSGSDLGTTVDYRPYRYHHYRDRDRYYRRGYPYGYPYGYSYPYPYPYYSYPRWYPPYYYSPYGPYGYINPNRYNYGYVNPYRYYYGDPFRRYRPAYPNYWY